MTLQLATFVVVWLALFSALASAGGDSSSGYNRFGRLTTRLQRQELNPTPYPAAGYRPDEPFDFPEPDKQQSFGDDENVEQSATQTQTQSQFQPEPQFQLKPQFPAQFQPQPRFQPQSRFQPQPKFQPQPQPQPEVSGFDLEATPNLGSNGDHIDQPNALYDTPARFRQTQTSARQRFGLSRQQLSTSSAQQSSFTQNLQSNSEQTSRATSPQRVYNAPLGDNSRQGKQFTSAQQSFPRNYPQLTDEQPRSARLRSSATKSERLTAADPEQQREEREDEDEDDATDIEVNEVKKTTATGGTPAVAAAPLPPTTTSVFYYPAGAVGFVHPLTAAYYQPSTFIAAAAPTLAPASTVATTPASAANPATAVDVSSNAEAKPAAVTALASQIATPVISPFAAQQYYAASPYLQQYTLAAPAQLQAW